MLFMILLWGSWLALQPGYSLSPWMPYALMRWLGFPYSALLWLDHNIATLIHFVVATTGVILLYHSSFLLPKLLVLNTNRTSTTRPNPLSPSLCAAAFCVLALFTEIAQLLIGRGFDYSDLFAGWLGAAIGYRLICRHEVNEPKA